MLVRHVCLHHKHPRKTRNKFDPQETKEDHDDKRRRIVEPESIVPTAAQDELLAPCPVTFDSGTRDDEVAVDVPVPEETAEMSGENSRSQKKPSSQSHLVHDRYGSGKR